MSMVCCFFFGLDHFRGTPQLMPSDVHQIFVVNVSLQEAGFFFSNAPLLNQMRLLSLQPFPFGQAQFVRYVLMFHGNVNPAIFLPPVRI